MSAWVGFVGGVVGGLMVVGVCALGVLLPDGWQAWRRLRAWDARCREEQR